MKITNNKKLQKALEDAVDPVAEKVEQEANHAAAQESTLDGKVEAFTKVLKQHGMTPDKRQVRKAFKDQGVE